MLKERRESEGWTDALIMDAGDLFHDRFSISPAERARVEATASFLVAQYNATGCRGYTPGDRDLVLGRPLLTKLSEEAEFPFLAANLVDATTGEPVFRKRTMVTLDGGVKVGVFGVTLPPTARGSASAESSWKVLDAVQVSRAEVQALRAAGAHVVVALAHLSEKDEAKLAQEVPGITVILGGQGTRMLQHPEQHGDTFVADAFSKGKYVSLLTLNVLPGNAASGPFVDRYQKKGLEKKRRQVASRLQSYERIMERQAAKKEEGAQGVLARSPRAGSPAPGFYEKQVEGFRVEMAALDRQLAAATEVDPTANFVEYSLVPLSKTVAHEPTIDEAVLSFREKFPKKPGK